MPITALTVEQHIIVASRLLNLARTKFLENKALKYHAAGPEYTSIMVCFLLHISSTIDALLCLYKSNPGWFPVSNALVLLRPVFEMNINGLYISRDPNKRAIAFIEYGRLRKREWLKRLLRHKDSEDNEWSSLINDVLQDEYFSDQTKIEKEYLSVKQKFEFMDKKGKKRQFLNWANMSLRQMAVKVDHEIEYDFFYSDLSEFTHGSVHLADLFLKADQWPLKWSTRADEGNIGLVFGYAGTFFSCFLSSLGSQFGMDIERDLKECRNFH